MSTITECLEYIVGLSTSDCVCDTPPPADSDTSLSGLYLNNLFDINLFKGLANCTGSFWDELTKARQSAVKDLQKDIFVSLQNRIQPRRARFVGTIGSINTKAVARTTQPYIGLRLFCADVVGGVMTIGKICTYFTTTGHTVTMLVKNQWGATLYSYAIPIVNTYQENTLSTPIILNLHEDLTNNPEYFIVYQYDSINPPYANDLNCKCGNFKPYYDRRRPYFNTQTGKAYGFANWVMIGGYAGTLTDLDCLLDVSNTLMNGIVLKDVEIKCSPTQMFCLHDWNFEEPFDVTVAFAILHKLGIYAIDYFLRTPEFDRENLINRDVLVTAKIDFFTEYEKELKYIAYEFPLEETDCYEHTDPGINITRLWR